MQQGWIKLHRTLLEHPFWLSQPFTKPQAWVDLLLLANHQSGFFFAAGRKVPVERGQVGRSLLTLGERWQWSRGKVDRFMTFLENEHMVDLKTGQHNSIITICNYDTFQSVHKENDTTDDTTDRTPDGHQTGQQTDTRRDTNKKVKTVDNGKNGIMKEKYSESFTEFWTAYPDHRRGNKKRALIEWGKIDESQYQIIIDNVIDRSKHDADWLNENGKFICHAERFLSGVRWENGYTLVDSRFAGSDEKTQRTMAAMQQLVDEYEH